MRSQPLFVLIAFLFVVEPSGALTTFDRNNDGRVDHVSVSMGNYSDIKIDYNFDGTWDAWLLYSNDIFIEMRLENGAPVKTSISLSYTQKYLTFETPLKVSKIKFKIIDKKGARWSMGFVKPGQASQLECSQSGKSTEAEMAVHAASTVAKSQLDSSCLATVYRKLAAERILELAMDVMSEEPTNRKCVTDILEKYKIPQSSLGSLKEDFLSTNSPRNPLIFCEKTSKITPVSQSTDFPPKLFIMFSDSDNLLCIKSEPKVARHEVGHLIASRACKDLGPSSSFCDDSKDGPKEQFANDFESELTVCLVHDLTPGGVKNGSAVREGVRSANGSIATSQGISDVPIQPINAPDSAKMHELTFVKPTADWVPTPSHVAEATKALAKPMIEYAERARSAILPSVRRQLAILPVADAREEASSREQRRKSGVSRVKAASGTSDQADLELNSKPMDSVRVSQATNVGKVTAADDKAIQDSIGKISAGDRGGVGDARTANRQKENLPAGPRRLEGGKGVAAAPNRAKRDSGGAGQSTVARSSDGDEEIVRNNDDSQNNNSSSGGRGPAAINPRGLIDSLVNRDVEGVDARTLAKQLAAEKTKPIRPLNDALIRKGIAIVDTVGNKYGKSYKEAALKYVIRGEKITDMSE